MPHQSKQYKAIKGTEEYRRHDQCEVRKSM